MTVRTLKIGIYGKTQAGKTHFLYTLIQHLESLAQRSTSQDSQSTSPILSLEAQDWRQRIQQQIGSDGHTQPTLPSTAAPDLEFRMPVEGVGSGSGSGQMKVVVRDLCGELLEQELDRIEKASRSTAMSQQVGQCDGFLFFYEPTSWEQPSRIVTHQKRESQRAKRFLQYVAKRRQNKFLPIVFVVTRRDQWIDDPKIKGDVDHWKVQTRGVLKSIYGDRLAAHQPPELSDPAMIFAETSIEQPQSILAAVGQLDQIVQACNHFQRTDRKRSLKILAASGLVVTLIGAAIIAVSLNSPASSERTIAPVQPAAAVTSRLRSIQDFFFTHPPGVRLEDAEVKLLNQHLDWMVAALKSPASENDRQTILRLGQEATRHVAAMLPEASLEPSSDPGATIAAGNPGGDPAALEELKMTLQNLPHLSVLSSELGQIQTDDYWTLQRSAIAIELATVIRTREQAESVPLETLTELSDKLGRLASRINGSPVYGPQRRQSLLDEIRVAELFVSGLIQGKSYRADFRVVSARLEREESLRSALHALSIGSKNNASISLKPTAQSERLVTFSTVTSSFDLLFDLDREVAYRLSEFREGKWEQIQWIELDPADSLLAPLGLPLHLPTDSKRLIRISRDGYEIKMEFSDLPPVPSLIWSAVGQASG